MDPHAHPSFEVATIKPSAPDDHNSGFHTEAERIWVENQRMSDILGVAFDVHKTQLINVPDWCTSLRFDIRGVADQEGVPGWHQQQEMLRALLQDRLALRFHHEQRELARFTLRAPAGAAKLKAAAPADFDLPDQTGSGNAGVQDWRITNNTMGEFAEFLRNFVQRPVVDETGLHGAYDFHLTWAREDAAPGADASGVPGLLTALQEQLGLKLESNKGLTDTIVIDHIDRPSPD